jgi:acyl-homoserine lactone acylase PvdQ
MKETLTLLEKATGSADMKDWRWGDIHVIRYDHFLGKSALLEPIVSYGPFPFEGDGETNNRARFKEVKPPYVGYLASAPRMVVRFDPEPRAWMMLITGENEYFMSRHRTDMITAWRNHEYFNVEKSEVRYRMKLTPEKGD